MAKQPLKYNISSWNQLPDCKSNNSKYLYLATTHFFGDERLTGTLISVLHEDFGTLFSCLIDSGGTMLNTESKNKYHEFTTTEILAELYKYGFDITYSPREHLDGDQLAYLTTLSQLGFEKIRMANIHSYDQTGTTQYNPTIVAFNIEQNPYWINNGYSPSEFEFLQALNNGSAINVSALSFTKQFRWDWLDYVASIDDILEDNRGE